MSRWKPDARQRLALAALDLYATQGYDATTVAQIAARAGVTSRTYFRYFPDKREVLFSSADKLRDRIAASLSEAPPDLPPLTAALHAMATCEHLYDVAEHEHLRRREAVIVSSNELQEREARKLESLAAVTVDGLIGRGSDEDTAHLVADVAVLVFKQAARLWMEEPTTPYRVLLDRAFGQAGEVLVPEMSRSVARA